MQFKEFLVGPASTAAVGGQEVTAFRRGGDIIEAVTTSNKEMAKLWTSTHKRERVEKEVPEEPVMEIRPNLREALYVAHLMPMTISPKAMSWGHNLKATVAIKYFTHSQCTAKKHKSNVQLEHNDESMGTRTVSMS